METASEKQKDLIAKLIIAGGYILFCVVVYVGFLFYLFAYTQRPDTSVNIIATNLPPKSPTPSISFTSETGVTTPFFEDDFTNDRNGWAELNSQEFTLEVKEGKLCFESLIEGNFAVAKCEECSYLQAPYYVQADFVTTAPTNQDFGIVFALNRNGNLYYLFQINTESKEYFLYHLGSNGWSRRIRGGSDQIKSFPNVNTLAVYASEGNVEFYINNQIVDSYVQTGENFHLGLFGFYVDDSGFGLTIDNLAISKINR